MNKVFRIWEKRGPVGGCKLGVFFPLDATAGGGEEREREQNESDRRRWVGWVGWIEVYA